MSRKLFRAAAKKQHHYNAYISGGKGAAEYRYLTGYYEAAKALVDLALESPGPVKDKLIFPICFNYRHYVELMLKRLILAVEKLHRTLRLIGNVRDELEASAESKLVHEHSIEKLYNWLIERISLITDEEVDDHIRKTVMQLHSVDPNSQVFRYPFKKDRSVFIPKQRVDLVNIQQRMEEVHNYLWGIDMWIQAESDAASETISAMQDLAQHEDYYGW